MGFSLHQLDYQHWANCPLCGNSSTTDSIMKKENYYFGQYRIPLPQSRITLEQCTNCRLIFKSHVPGTGGFNSLLEKSASAVWKVHKGQHPAIKLLSPLLESGANIIDVGASNGDLLLALKRFGQASSKNFTLSAIDLVEFEHCRAAVTGDYFIGSFDDPREWTAQQYDLVIGLDIFEHFLSPAIAIAKILSLVKPGGKLVLETGDWMSVANRTGWYYSNMIEHHIFWTKETFEYLCNKHKFSLQHYVPVNHKGRRGLPTWKKALLHIVTTFSKVSIIHRLGLQLGLNLRKFGAPGLRDHAFIVLSRDL